MLYQPAAQLTTWHAPAMQLTPGALGCGRAAQLVPHAPHDEMDVSVLVSQPLPARPSQLPQPGSHDVTVHVPLTPETDGLIDARRLALLRDGACFVNTARGEIVEEAALVAELVSGRIRAGLDVFVDEPNVPAELLDLPNVVLTPHLGSATRQAREAMTRLVVDNLLAVERGDPPLTPVAPLA